MSQWPGLNIQHKIEWKQYFNKTYKKEFLGMINQMKYCIYYQKDYGHHEY